MIQKILFSFLLFFSIVLAQKKYSPIFIEHNSILSPHQVEYISYKIPFDQLLFVKNGEGYKAKFTLIFGIYKEGDFITREISEKEILTDSYDDTKSNEVYFEDVISFKLEPADYILKPTLAIGSTELDITLPEIKLQVNNLLGKIIYPPVVINNNIKRQNNHFVFELTNLQNYIPFSPNQFGLLIGIKDTLVNTIDIEITQNEESIYEKQIPKLFDGKLKIKKDTSIKIYSDTTKHPSRYFLINGFTHKLEEGEFQVLVKNDTNVNKFPLEVFWQNKPKVLKDAEYSIKLLSYIEDADVIRSLFGGDEINYYKNLFDYWTEHYPSNIKYNFAIDEYYSRADYAIKNFSSLKSKKGAQSDRGKIYITYGKPSAIDRHYNERNEIIEIWIYDSINKTFVFKDITGTGEYILVEE